MNNNKNNDKRLKRKKIVIYTAIFGDYDDLKNTGMKIPECDFVCFTDNSNLEVGLFDIRLCQRKFVDPARDSRMYKLLPHKFFPEYEYSLYVDASVIIRTKDIVGLVKKYLSNYNWAVFLHPERDCIYDEARACIGAKKDNRDIIEKQMKKYKKEKYPTHNGLIENTVLLRRHNVSEAISLGEAWWSEVEQFSKRDQLSFNYVAWKQGFHYASIDGFLWDIKQSKYNNKLFEVEPHKK